MRKKVLAYTLCFAMICSLMPMSAARAEGSVSEETESTTESENSSEETTEPTTPDSEPESQSESESESEPQSESESESQETEHTHKWGDVTYTWEYLDAAGEWQTLTMDDAAWMEYAENEKQCIANRTCTVDGCPAPEESETETAAKSTDPAETYDATCTKPGKVTYQAVFTNIGEAQTKEIEIPVLDHKPSDTWSKDETSHWHECENGCTEKLEVADHTWNDGVVTTESTCTENGVKTVTCTVCGEAKTEDVQATGHKPSDTWSKDETSHWHECENGCTEKLDKADHTWNKGVVTTDPTCTGKGVKTFTCTACDVAKTEDIQATGHDYGEPEWSWVENAKGYTATATFTCKHCSDRQKITATVNRITKEATCTSTGTTTYTATAAFEGKEYTCPNEKTKEIPMISHTYQAPAWTWTDDTKNGTCEAEVAFECEQCSQKWTIPANINIKVNEAGEEAVVDPTCTEDGSVIYTATADFDGEEYSVGEHKVAIQKTGHAFTWTSKKDATCTTKGNKAYGTCANCWHYFDEDGEHEIAANSWIIPAKGHVLSKAAAKEATCTAAGNREYHSCSVCKAYFSDKDGKHEIAANSWVIHATGHHIITEEKKPTKKVQGKVVKKCDACDHVEKEWTIPAKTLTLNVGKSAKLVKKNTADYTFSLANAKKYSKYFKLNAKTGKITVKKNYTTKFAAVPVKIRVGGKSYTVKVQVKIPAPKVTITKSRIWLVNGKQTNRYTLSYDIKGATKIRVRVKGLPSVDAECDTYISKPKSDSQSYLNIKDETIKKLGNKVTFEIIAYYGENKSEKRIKVVK